MADPSLSQRERELLHRLTALVADRAAGEQALAERRRRDTKGAEADYRDAAESAETAFAKAAAALDAERQRAEAEVGAKYERELAAAKRRMDTHIRNYNQRTAAIGSAANTEYEEAKWLAETLVESGESKIRNDFELVRKAVEARERELAGILVSADDLLTSARHPSVAVPEEPEAAPAPDGSRDELLKALNEARAELRVQAGALASAVRPKLLRPFPIVLAAVLVAAGAGFGAHQWGEARTTEQIAKIALAAAGGVLVVLLAARLLARRRVPAAAGRFAGAMAQARRTADALMRRAVLDQEQQHRDLLAKRDEEVAKNERRIAAVRREVARRVNVNYPRLRDRHARRISDIRGKQESELNEIRRRHAAQSAAAGAERDGTVKAAEELRDRRMRELDELELHERGILQRLWHGGFLDVQAQLMEIERTMGELCPSWDSPDWAAFGGRERVPPAVRFGLFDVDVAQLPGGLSTDPDFQVPEPTRFATPALLDLLDKGSVLIRSGPEGGPAAVALLQEVMLRILTAFPPGKARFTIVDPVGLGQNFAGFMHLADHDEALVGGRIWTDPKHVEQRLVDLTEHMETVIQKYLRNEFQTIQEYNEKAGEIAEPYRFLVFADFPANLTEAAAKRLASIAASGARCGLFTLIATGPNAKLPSWAPMAALEQSSAVLARKEGGFVWQDEEFKNWPLEVQTPPDEERITALMHRIGAASKDASKVQVPFEFVSPRPDQMWSLSTTNEVRVPLGRAGAKNLQYFTLGRGTAQHALIAGRTGSGKSTLLHVLVTNLAMWCSPDEIEMYLVDFKKGVEFKTYAAHELPHARVVAVESEREFGLSVLRRLDAELTRRGQVFRELGVQDMAGYRREKAAAHPVLPRTLLIVDEFQEFFVEDDKLAQEASLLLDRLVRQGRAFGMHVVLGSQTLGGAYGIARSTLGQMAVRIALQCSEADSYLIMSEDNAAARLLSRPGEAIYNDMSGRLEGNNLFQIVWLSDDKRDASLSLVAERAAENGRRFPPPIVFEGNIPADVARNHLLMSLLDGAGAMPRTPTAWLGDAISIKDPTSVSFRPQGGSNLLIVGQQEEAVGAMLQAMLLALGAWRGRAEGGSAEVAPGLSIIDATPADLPEAHLLESVVGGGGDTGGGTGGGWPGGGTFARPREAGAVVASLVAELERREASGQHAHPPHFLVVCGLHRVRDLRKGDEFAFSSSGEPTSPAQQFARLLREGPPLGIHAIVWCDSATNVDRTLERGLLREFDSRVLFQMSANDSTQLIDAPTASTLGRHRALLHSEETGVAEKFRPYAMPDAEWLRRAWGRLAAYRLGSGTGKNV